MAKVGKESVVVLLEGAKVARDDRGLAPLQWAMRSDVLNSGGKLVVVSILQQHPAEDSTASRPTAACFSFGLPSFKEKQSLLPREGDRYHHWSMHRQISEQRETFLRIFRPFYNICKCFDVHFEAKLAAGREPDKIGIEAANDSQATWVVIDRCLGIHWSLILCCKSCKVAVVNEEEVQLYSSASPKCDGWQPSALADVVPRLDHALKLAKESSTPEEDHGRDSSPVLLHKCGPLPSSPSTTETSKDQDLDAAVVLRQPVKVCWDEIVKVTDGFATGRLIWKDGNKAMYGSSLRGRPIAVMRITGDDVEGVVAAEKRAASSLLHRNIHRILGFCCCDESDVCAFVYPHLPKTLEDYLSDADQEGEVVAGFTCAQRMKIAIEIGQGVRYMHKGCPGGPVVHGDLRPRNIFFSNGFQPLISGFGRARWLQDEEAEMNRGQQRIIGSERWWDEQLSKDSSSDVALKSDVFSFGMLLLRLFGRRSLPSDDADLLDWAQPFLSQGALLELADQDMEDLDMYDIYRAISAATWCMNTKTLRGPDMTQVVSILKGEHPCAMQSFCSVSNSSRGLNS